ncbi:MAG: diguanylate cyclase [Methylococcaceae bacterium]|nr:diguanylate cyclase [Methylococcaceae bacterium]
MLKKLIKVLIIDNSAIAQTVSADLYDQLVARVTLLASGAEGLALAETEMFELVCVAYAMTDMNAEDFCCQLRNLPGYEHATVILFAAETDKVALKEAMLVGATDVVSKNNVEQLKHYLHRHIERLTRNIMGKVLLVEDSPSQQLLIQHLLEQMGLEVELYTSAKKAWHTIQQAETQYDLVITDTILDGEMSGVALVREMRNNLNEEIETPVLAMSAIDEKSRRIELLHLGVNDYILKPIVREELQARVGNLIENRRMLAEIMEQRKMLEQLALIDPVTKLYNRNAFNDIGPKQLESAARNNIPLCLVVADIDYFKRVNDEYGHIRGDAVLTEMGECLKSYIRRGDLVFRWGGEEFVLLLACNAKKGAVLVEKIRYKIAQTKFAQVSITASFGLSWVEPGQLKHLHDLFEQADKALLQAKSGGRNRVCVYSDDAL